MNRINQEDFPELTHLLNHFLSIGGDTDFEDYIEAYSSEKIQKLLGEIKTLINGEFSDQMIIEFLESTYVIYILAENTDEWNGYVGKENLQYLYDEIRELSLTKRDK